MRLSPSVGSLRAGLGATCAGAVIAESARAICSIEEIRDAGSRAMQRSTVSASGCGRSGTLARGSGGGRKESCRSERPDRLCLPRGLAHEHLVEDEPKRINVRAVIDG